MMPEHQNNQISQGKVVLGPEMLSACLAWRCRRDDAFRDRLESDPRKCIEELSGQKIPDSVKIVITENADKVWNIPLPSPESLKGQRQLTEEDLDKVVGGIFFTSVVGVASTTILGIALVATGVVGTGAVIGGIAATALVLGVGLSE